MQLTPGPGGGLRSARGSLAAAPHPALPLEAPSHLHAALAPALQPNRHCSRKAATFGCSAGLGLAVRPWHRPHCAVDHPAGALIADDTGALADAGMGVRFLEDGDTATADAVVIATDDPPPEASLQQP